MVFKICILFFIVFFYKLSFSNIIYDKNEITITGLELEEYIIVYEENYNLKLNKNTALKNLILMKRTIDFLKLNNPEFIEILDINIKKQYGEKIYDKNIKKDFFRFLKIRNEFISEYFLYEFDVEELKLVFLESEDLKLPISNNNCLTIIEIIDLKDNDFFMESLFENIRNKNFNFVTEIDNEIYSTCIDNKKFREIEASIIKYLESKTEKKFNEFIYGKKN